MPTIKLSGTVFSGKGQGKRFVELPWVKRQLVEKTGFTPFAGTLNIRLDEESTKQRVALDKLEGIEVKPEAGYFPGFLYKATLNGDVMLHCDSKSAQLPRKRHRNNRTKLIYAKNLSLKDEERVTVEVTV